MLIYNTLRRYDGEPFVIRFVFNTNNNYLNPYDMNKNQIGVNAGKIWRLLNDNNRWKYEDLKRAAELSDRDMNAAIGWLAREDKVEFETENGSDCFFLTLNVFIG